MDLSHFVIRPVQQKDLAELASLLADSFHDRRGFMHWLFPVLRMGIYEDLRSRLRSAPHHYACLVAAAPSPSSVSDQRCLAGTVEVALRTAYSVTATPDRYPYLSNLAVKPECRRQGIAQQLLVASEQIVLEWGFRDIYLHVLENNHQARKLYFKAGYRLEQSDPGWLCWLLRRPRRFFLRKRLGPFSTTLASH